MVRQFRNRTPQRDVVVNLVQAVRFRLLTLPRSAKQAALIVADVVSYAVAALLAVWVLSNANLQTTSTLLIVLVAVVVAVAIHYLFGIYASIVRYMGIALLATGLRATMIVSAILAVVCWGLKLSESPIRLSIVFWSFSLIPWSAGRRARQRRFGGSAKPMSTFSAPKRSSKSMVCFVKLRKF